MGDTCDDVDEANLQSSLDEFIDAMGSVGGGGEHGRGDESVIKSRGICR